MSNELRNNTVDTTYLFRRGHPTWHYYDLFNSSTISPEVWKTIQADFSSRHPH